MKRTIINLILLLSFFPFFKLIPWIDAEVQPYGAFLGLLYLMIFTVKKDRVSLIVMFFFLLLVLYTSLSLLYAGNASSVIMLSGAYALPLFLLLALKDNTHLLSVKVFYASLILYLAVGALQSFSLLAWAEPYVDPLIPRFLGRPHGLGGRGVSFLANEPSYAAYIITLMMATGSFFYLTRRISGRGLAMTVIAVLAMLFMNRSGTVFMFLSSFLVVFSLMMFRYGSAAKKTKVVVLSPAIVPLAMVIGKLGVQRFASSARFIGLLHELPQLIGSGDLFSIVGALSARFLTVFMGYFSLLDRFGIGHGIASYRNEYLRLSAQANLDWGRYAVPEAYASGDVMHKPHAYGPQIALDLGIPGLGLIALIVFFCWGQGTRKGLWRREEGLRKSLAAAIYAVAILLIFVLSSTAMPVAWVMLAYVHDYLNGFQEYGKSSFQRGVNA